jgi:hypothetical protein
MRTRGAPTTRAGSGQLLRSDLHPTLSDVRVRLGHAIETFRVAEIFRSVITSHGSTYKGAGGFSLELNRKLEVIRAEPSEGVSEATPGRTMQRKLGRPDALPQQAW